MTQSIEIFWLELLEKQRNITEIGKIMIFKSYFGKKFIFGKYCSLIGFDRSITLITVIENAKFHL